MFISTVVKKNGGEGGGNRDVHVTSTLACKQTMLITRFRIILDREMDVLKDGECRLYPRDSH